MRLKQITNKLTWIDAVRIVAAAAGMLFLLLATRNYFESIAILFIIEVVDFMSGDEKDRLRAYMGWAEDATGVLITTILMLIYIFSTYTK